MDKLDKLFEKQIKLQTKLNNYPFLDLKDKQEFININILASLDELSEVLRETVWKNPKYIKKGWKKTQIFNKENFQEELVDLWHFVINLTICSGLNSQEFFGKFINKNKINHERQKKGY